MQAVIATTSAAGLATVTTWNLASRQQIGPPVRLADPVGLVKGVWRTPDPGRILLATTSPGSTTTLSGARYTVYSAANGSRLQDFGYVQVADNGAVVFDCHQETHTRGATTTLELTPTDTGNHTSSIPLAVGVASCSNVTATADGKHVVTPSTYSADSLTTFQGIASIVTGRSFFVTIPSLPTAHAESPYTASHDFLRGDLLSVTESANRFCADGPEPARRVGPAAIRSAELARR